MMGRYLLIISCSGSKDKTKDKFPAIKRYTGVYYKILNKFKKEEKLCKDLDIIIISAKYGFLRPNDLIDYYDQKMDKRRAKLLNKQIISNFKEYFKNKSYKEIFVNLGKEYMIAIKGFEKYIPSSTEIIIAEGRIGKKMKQMKNWLSSIK